MTRVSVCLNEHVIFCYFCKICCCRPFHFCPIRLLRKTCNLQHVRELKTNIKTQKPRLSKSRLVLHLIDLEDGARFADESSAMSEQNQCTLEQPSILNLQSLQHTNFTENMRKTYSGYHVNTNRKINGFFGNKRHTIRECTCNYKNGSYNTGGFYEIFK